MKYIKPGLPYLMAFILLSGAAGHLIVPEMYAPMIPPFIPPIVAHGFSVLLGAGLGLLLLIPPTRHLGGLGFMGLMLVFLPIHTWDFFRETPAIGPHPAPDKTHPILDN